MTCTAPNCERPAEPHRKWCRGHRDRAKFGKIMAEPIRPWGQTPKEAAERAALAYADAESNSEYNAASKRLRVYMTRYGKQAKRGRPRKRSEM